MSSLVLEKQKIHQKHLVIQDHHEGRLEMEQDSTFSFDLYVSFGLCLNKTEGRTKNNVGNSLYCSIYSLSKLLFSCTIEAEE